jgi:hypothetical protein
MARIDYWQYLLDNQGNPLEYAEVRVYLAGTLTEANIYLDSTFGSVTKASVEDLKTDKYGFIQFWVGDRWEAEGGYQETQQFKIVWQNTVDGIEEVIDNLYIFTPVRPIVTTDSVKGVPSNKDKDKVISNQQGYDWDTHVDLTLPSGSPHGIAPAEKFTYGLLQSRVISNKLGYQMWNLATAASTTASASVDVSGAGIYPHTASWTPSGDVYYDTITHGLGNSYPVVELVRSSNNEHIMPVLVRSLNPNEVRVWVDDNVGARIVVLG